MNPEDIDQILSSDDVLEPAAGFVMSVMDRVRRQAHELPPRRFPWLRFTIGLIGCLTAAVSATVLALSLEPYVIRLCAPLASLSGIEPDLGYATAALVVSFGFVSYQRLKSTT